MHAGRRADLFWSRTTAGTSSFQRASRRTARVGVGTLAGDCDFDNFKVTGVEGIGLDPLGLVEVDALDGRSLLDARSLKTTEPALHGEISGRIDTLNCADLRCRSVMQTFAVAPALAALGWNEGLLAVQSVLLAFTVWIAWRSALTSARDA